MRRALILLIGSLLMSACSETSTKSSPPYPATPEPVSATIETGTVLDMSGGAGPKVVRFAQTAPNGLSAEWLSWGATLARLRLPDGTDVTASLPNNAAYTQPHPYIGASVGRVANRIKGGQFELDGATFSVPPNDGEHALHGGPEGFSHHLWRGGFKPGGELILEHVSPDGDQGFPGELSVVMSATLGANFLRVTYRATTTAPTPVNLTLHGYWDPSGQFDQPVDTLTLQSPAERYTAVDDALIPTGKTPATADTRYDFAEARPIGEHFLDANLFVPGEGLREMARLTDGTRTIVVSSDYPGLQVYSGEALQQVGLPPRAALALEPQYPPDAVNQPNGGEDTVLRPGETYEHTILFTFAGPGLP